MMTIASRVLILVTCSAGLLSAQSKSAGLPSTATWPHWRGPSATGAAPGDAPLTWDDKTNVRWKVEIPGRGHSSPVIWGDRIFLTTAVPTGKTSPEPPASGRGPRGVGAGVEHRFVVMAVDRLTGKQVWEHTATTATPHEGHHQLYGSFASNSPVTDGSRVYAFFGSRGLFAYDLSGKPIWQKDFGIKMRMFNSFGEGSAMAIEEGRLIVNFDHEDDSFVAMLDAATGKEIWRVARAEGTSWSAPFVARHAGQRQIVLTASTKVKAYEFETGKLIWEAAGLGRNTIPTPVQQGDLLFAMSGYRDPRLMAIRLGRTGDLTATDAIVWQTTRGTSYTATPVIQDNRLYVLTDSGMLSAFNATTGEPFYHQTRLPKPYNFKASPVAINGKLYLATEEGDTVVVKMGDAFEVLATNTLTDQSFIATPAVASGDLYLRSRTHLFRISER